MLELAAIHVSWELLSVMGTIIASTVGCTIAITKRLDRFEQRLAKVEEDRYTMTEACEHAFRTAVANPDMRVPDPRHPGEYIQVQLEKTL